MGIFQIRNTQIFKISRKDMRKSKAADLETKLKRFESSLGNDAFVSNTISVKDNLRRYLKIYLKVEKSTNFFFFFFFFEPKKKNFFT